jgi:hypothetical protein
MKRIALFTFVLLITVGLHAQTAEDAIKSAINICKKDMTQTVEVCGRFPTCNQLQEAVCTTNPLFDLDFCSEKYNGYTKAVKPALPTSAVLLRALVVRPH